MEKGLLFFTLSVLCLWVILDEFFGNGMLSSGIKKVTPDVSLFSSNKYTEEETKEKVEEWKTKVDNNDGIKTDGAKQSIKNIIDHFYETTNPQREMYS